MIAQTAALTILANNYDQAIAAIGPLVENLEEGVLDILLFLLNYGLSIVFWTALVGIPAVLIVRAIRARSAKRSW